MKSRNELEGLKCEFSCIAGTVSVLKYQLYFYMPETNSNKNSKAIFYCSKKKKTNQLHRNWEKLKK